MNQSLLGGGGARAGQTEKPAIRRGGPSLSDRESQEELAWTSEKGMFGSPREDRAGKWLETGAPETDRRPEQNLGSGTRKGETLRRDGYREVLRLVGGENLWRANPMSVTGWKILERHGAEKNVKGVRNLMDVKAVWLESHCRVFRYSIKGRSKFNAL